MELNGIRGNDSGLGFAKQQGWFIEHTLQVRVRANLLKFGVYVVANWWGSKQAYAGP
ncbi:MAG: hypothetical protein ACKVJU_19880 [Verrucomicrobiales bacterium]